MKYFVGTDIIEVSRVKEAINRTASFKENVYTKNEIAIGNNKSEITVYEYYAGRFAAKEAIYKAISCIDNTVTLNEIEILNDINNKNRPYVDFLKPSLHEMVTNNKIAIDVSISHIKDFATANAVCYIADVNKLC